MHLHRRILWAYSLSFISKEFDFSCCKHLRSFGSYSCISCNQNPFCAIGPSQNCFCVHRCDLSLMPDNMTNSHEMGQIQLIHSLSVMKKVERGIHMGTIMGAHGKGTQIVQVACLGRVQRLFFGPGIAGIDRAGKYFLADVVDFHVVTSFLCHRQEAADTAINGSLFFRKLLDIRQIIQMGIHCKIRNHPIRLILFYRPLQGL